jgi:molybdopterin-containing oxidoreductase family iron-sulfur binding subunit
LTVLGTAAAGKIVCQARRAAGATTEPTSAPAVPPGPALTSDHQVINAQASAPLSAASLAARQGVPGRKWIMVIDLAKCDGCGKCISACSKMHFIPPDRQWIKVLRMQESEKTAPYFFPQPCYHCDNPPCTKVCPVDATFKRSDGAVLIDNERCIGCRFCMAACPYGARSFNWGHPNDPPEALEKGYSPEYGYPRRVGTVEKCDFCTDMAAMGMLPSCVSGCPMGAMYYGDENEDAVTNAQGETERLSKLLLDRDGYRHMEELGTKPRVYYLAPKNRMYAPPGSPAKA